MNKSAKESEYDFLNLLSAPARRALENANIINLKKLSSYTESEILRLHGIGPTTLPILKNQLAKALLSFKENPKKMNDDIKEYISRFPSKTQKILNKIRKLILNTDKGIKESMSYGMPAYKYKNKPVMYYAAYEHHIGIYATPNAHTEFQEVLSVYKQGKGSVQFPIDEEIPFTLIEKMLKYNLNSYK